MSPKPFITSFRPRLSHKKCIHFFLPFEQREQEKRRDYLSRTVLLLTFTFSLISELSRGFSAMPVCYGVKVLYCLFRLVLFLVLSSAFILFIIILDLICMHARFLFLFCFCCFFNERLVIHPAIHSFVVHLL